MDAERNLLFGLLALQNGLINQAQLVAAFQAWSLDKAQSLADCLVARRDLNAAQRAAIEALAALHMDKHGGDAKKSLAAIPAGPSTRESLAQIGDPDIGGTLIRVGSDSPSETTIPIAQPPILSARPLATASDSGSCGPTPGAAWATSSSPWTASSTARWP